MFIIWDLFNILISLDPPSVLEFEVLRILVYFVHIVIIEVVDIVDKWDLIGLYKISRFVLIGFFFELIKYRRDLNVSKFLVLFYLVLFLLSRSVIVRSRVFGYFKVFLLNRSSI